MQYACATLQCHPNVLSASNRIPKSYEFTDEPKSQHLQESESRIVYFSKQADAVFSLFNTEFHLSSACI